MQIEKLKTEQLIPSDYNPRKDLKPGDPEYDKLKRSIEQFGYVEPVIWNKTTGRVVGGHQRLKVLIDMGITEVDCVVVELPEEKEKALNIALNKISGEWDKDKLALLIADLQGADFDVSLTGFDPAELDADRRASLIDDLLQGSVAVTVEVFRIGSHAFYVFYMAGVRPSGRTGELTLRSTPPRRYTAKSAILLL